MAQSLLVELELPGDWRRFRMPRALQDRLQDLLDRQDQEGKLTPKERREATALAELVDLLSLMRLRAELATKRRAAELPTLRSHAERGNEEQARY
jgi:hypothetical protein